jgi:hypothetical protein
MLVLVFVVVGASSAQAGSTEGFLIPDGATIPADSEGILFEGSPELFPSRTGGLQSRTALHKPFADIAKRIDLAHKFSPKGMRRTFQDLARAAAISDTVTRAVSGHATEAMQLHYSTVSEAEVHAGIAKIIDLAGVRALRTGGDRRKSGDPGGDRCRKEKRQARNLASSGAGNEINSGASRLRSPSCSFPLR